MSHLRGDGRLARLCGALTHDIAVHARLVRCSRQDICVVFFPGRDARIILIHRQDARATLCATLHTTFLGSFGLAGLHHP